MSDKDKMVLELSNTINKMIVDFEKEHNEKIWPMPQNMLTHPEDYPVQPKLQLIRVL